MGAMAMLSLLRVADPCATGTCVPDDNATIPFPVITVKSPCGTADPACAVRWCSAWRAAWIGKVIVPCRITKEETIPRHRCEPVFNCN
jgi:hypothetical protein